jgi:hypothetical protein
MTVYHDSKITEPQCTLVRVQEGHFVVSVQYQVHDIPGLHNLGTALILFAEEI